MPKRRAVIEFRDFSGFLGTHEPHRKHRHSSRLTDESAVPPSVTVSSRHRSVPSYRSRSRPRPKKRHKRRRRRHPRRARHTSTAHHRRRAFDEDDPLRDTYISPDDEHNVNLRSPRPSGYPDDFNPAERAVDPRLEHTFSPTGRPLDLPEAEEDDSDDGSGFQQMVYEGNPRRRPERRERADRHHRRQGHRHHRRGKRRRRRRKRPNRESTSDPRSQGDNETRDDGSGSHESDADSVKFDEEGNPIQPSDSQGRSSRWRKKFGKGSQDDGKPKKGKKRHIAKLAALALGAVVVGFAAKKFIARRRKKKADAEAELMAAQEEAESEAAGPYGGSGGQLLIGSNPLQLKVPKTSFSMKVPESEAFIVERGGKYNRRLNPGSNTLIPFVDRVAFRFSLKEVSMAVPPQQCFTRENISVTVSALLFAKVEDAVAAAYGVDDARRSLMLVAQISMRKEVARLGLEQMLLDRDGLADRILASINRASRPWGVRCTRFEVRDFDIPDEIRDAFARQAQIERQVRADILASQGANEAMRHRADGELHAQMRMSQAQGINVVNKATAEAQAISERGQAIAGALRDVAEVANEPGGKKAMHMRIAEQYIHAYMKASAGREDLPPVPSANDVADALGKGLGFLDVLTEPGSQLVGQPAELGESANLPPGRPALEHENTSGHSITFKPTPAASASESLHSRPSQQMIGTDLPGTHGTPQVQVGVSPLVGGTQPLPQSGLSYSQPSGLGETEDSNNSQSTQRRASQTAANQHPSGGYSGPAYPQAQA